MVDNLLDLKARELLEQFGAGNHKPGSGSAAAMNGMLACQLAITVIKLTSDHHEKYQRTLSRLEQLQSRLTRVLEPRLQTLFNEDSSLFGEVFNARQFRDEANRGSKAWWDRERIHLSKLKSATDLPIEIAELCLEASHIATEIFDIGYRSARGDTCVALSSAVSAAKGAIAVIFLNLRSFRKDDWPEWQEETRASAIRLKQAIEAVEGELSVRVACLEDRTTNEQIEEKARELQLKLYHNREASESVGPAQAIQLLDPVKALQLLEFEYQELETLGEIDTWSGRAKVAGLVDMPNKIVSVSPSLDPEVRRFTIAHELGHVVLHDFTIPHRDRAIDGSPISHRNDFERQADKFASYFLMPRRTTINLFREYFGQEKVDMSETTAFALGVEHDELKSTAKNSRSFSRLLASATRFGGRNFNSLSKAFGVSTEAGHTLGRS